ncbi:MAG: lipopolysaccharide biosynthesis protein [Terriglobales bacterium]
MAGAGTAPQVTACDVATRLIEASAIYAAANFAVKALNFLLLPLYAYFLSPAEYGVVSLAETIAIVAGIAAGLGLPAGMQRLYFQYAERPEELGRYLGSVLRFGFGFALALLALVFAVAPSAMAHLFPQPEVPFYPCLALAVTTAATAQLLDYRLVLYQMEGKAKPFSALLVGYFTFAAVCSVALVAGVQGGSTGLLLGRMFGALGAATTAGLLLRRWFTCGWNWRYVRETLGLGLPLVPHYLMAAGLVAADRLVLARYRPLDEIGTYSLAYSLGMAMAVITTSLMQAYSPIFFDTARNERDGRRVLARTSMAVMTVIAVIGAAGVLASPVFVDFCLDRRYAAAARLIPWVIGGYVLHGMFSLLHLAVLQAKRPGFVLCASGVACVTNIGLNLLLAPHWGMWGAAWATTAAYAIEATVMYLLAQRVFALPWRRRQLGAALAMFGCALAATQMLQPAMLAVGAAICGVASWWLLRGDMGQVVRMLRGKAVA